MLLAVSCPSGSANIEVTEGLSADLTGVARLFTDVPYLRPAGGIRIRAPAGRRHWFLPQVFTSSNDCAVVLYERGC
jgi:hypothetical protein